MSIFERIEQDKKDYLELLLIADPSEEMIDRYLEKGELYVMKKDGCPVAVAVVFPIDRETVELKNIAVRPEYRQQGLATQMIAFLQDRYAGEGYRQMTVGTGGTGIAGREFYQVGFYRKCGFRDSHVIRNFFTDHYAEPIIEENGWQCVDMIYLVCSLDKK